jgi:hypothetical protein
MAHVSFSISKEKMLVHCWRALLCCFGVCVCMSANKLQLTVYSYKREVRFDERIGERMREKTRG